MKRVLFLFLVLVFLLPSAVLADSIQCSEYQIRMVGATVPVPGYDYREILEMHKVDPSSGYDGRWKVDRMVQIIAYPNGGAGPPSFPVRVNFANGQWMNCTAHFINNLLISDCSDGEFYLDVSKNRIGSNQSNVWLGQIQGRKAKYRFDPKNPNSPWLTGEIQQPMKSDLHLNISGSTGDRYVFDTSDPGVVEMQFEASVTPSQYEQDVEWTVPEIEGSVRTLDPPSGRGPRLKVRFEGLPSDNSQFGPKTVHAVVRAGSCRAEDEKTVNVFYPRDAKNNPGGEYPNWFYYWKQTPAGRPKGQLVRILWGGRDVEQCANPIVPAEYIPVFGHHATIHVCDLTKLGPDFPITYPLLSLKPPYYKGLTKSTYIDSFAVAVRHEYEHWQIHFNFRKYETKLDRIPTDTDGDGLPDHVEPQYGFDPTKKLTHLADHPVVKNVEEDEDWLCYMSMQEIAFGSLDKYDWAKPGKQWQ